METFNTIEEIKNIQPCCVALGNFDGVHAGHQALIKATVEEAHAKGLKIYKGNNDYTAGRIRKEVSGGYVQCKGSFLRIQPSIWT